MRGLIDRIIKRLQGQNRFETVLAGQGAQLQKLSNKIFALEAGLLCANEEIITLGGDVLNANEEIMLLRARVSSLEKVKVKRGRWTVEPVAALVGALVGALLASC
tara:strand:- start:420 stop:734 length:315 start_codon:yes stop_codon:yes gene_type:complete